MSYKKSIKKAGKILLYILGSVVLLLCLFLLFINLPVGKRIVRNKVQNYLEAKLKTKVSIGAIDYSLPKWIEIKSVYIEDQKKDTLVFGEKIAVDINMIQLIMGNTSIQKLLLKNILININRAEEDSTFNYQFVIDAFAGTKPATPVVKDTAALKITLDRLLLDHVSLRFKDKKDGRDFAAGIQQLDATLNTFQPDRINFGIQTFNASGLDFFMNTYKETVKDSLHSNTSTAASEPSYGLHVSAAGFDIRDVNVIVADKTSGLYYANTITHLALQNVLFDQGHTLVTTDALRLDSSIVQFISPKIINKKNSGNAPGNNMPWVINAKEILLSNNHISYDDNNLAKAGGFDFGHFNIKGLGAKITAFSYAKSKTAALVNQLSFKDTSGFILDTVHANFLMTDSILSAKELYVKSPQTLLQNLFEIKYDSLNGIATNPKNSLLTAVLKNSTIAFNDLYLLVPELKTSFPPQQFANNSVHFNTELRGNLAQVYLPYLQLIGFSGTSLNAHGTLYNLTDVTKFSYDLYIDKSNFLKSDLLKFVPKENQSLLVQLPDVFNLTGHITGNKENLVADIQTNGKGIAFNGIFTLRNISNPAKLKYDFAIRSGTIDKNIILGFIPPGSLPPGINLPDKVSISGLLKGDIKNLVADVKINDSYGQATVKGFIKNMTDPATAVYDLFITTNNYEIGKLIRQDTIIGKVTGAFTAKGKGFDYKTMQSTITASVQQLQYNKYNYQHAEVFTVFNAGIIDSRGSINDSSVKLHYDIKANVQQEYPSITGIVKVDTAQLQKLHLYKDTLNFSLAANIHADNLQPRNLSINTVIDSIKMQVGKNLYSLDSVSLVATSAAGKDDINFNTSFANLHANGAFDYDKVGDAIVQYVNHYYKISDSVNIKNIPGQQLSFEGNIKKHPFLIGIIPGLKDYNDINFKGSFASANTDSALNLSMTLPYLAYEDKALRNGVINFGSKSERINYAITFDTLNYKANTFYGTALKGSAARDSILLSAFTQDNKRKDWFGLKASLSESNSIYSFRLKDSLLLNYEKWNVTTDNYINYSPAGLIIHNFLITSDTSTISIKSRAEIVNSPIDIAIDNFNFKSISAIISNDTLFASGIMDAKMEVNDLYKNIPAFTGNLTITDLQVMQQPMGNLTGSAKKQSENNITATLSLLGNGNDITANGNYYLNNEQQEFDFFTDIKKLNIATLQGFSSGKLKNATGNIHGDFTANGKFADPRWKGALNFDTTQFTVTDLGTAFKADNQKITFDYPVIKLDNFTIRDSLNHQMKIDGVVTVEPKSVFDLKLDINATDFIVLNAPRSFTNELYGFAAIDANISLTGNSVSPDIEGDIYVKDKSNVTIVIPEKSYGKDEGRTIVRFIDRDTFEINPPVTPFVQERDVQSNFAQFLNYNLNIEIQKKAALTIIIDPATGDEIKVQGDARLNAGVDPGGNIILAGNYNLDNGYYLFNYQFLQRKFILQKGSSIVFGGEPMKAKLDVVAAYTVNTAAKDLLGNEVGSVDPLLSNSFNQKVPFKVVLYLTGELSKPTIKFDIQLTEENAVISSDLRTTIENKLTQIRGDESATNKQVFSLLLLGRFTGEQSSDFFKGNGNDFNDIARQSVSQFLSGALNEIAGNLLKGVDIDLNLNSYRDYSNGGNAQRTDLNVALSKTFLDDKITVSVGKNFGVQGQDAAAKANNSFIPDVTIAYKLTKDGKYLLRAYRKNQFEVVLDGYVVETGLGFLVTMDYDKFNELFKRKKKK
ncbi:translocation/assembly module TamB domain-containing protein [Ferruginibacter sp. SUN106]|uniref:translocation/assembly module TamB domain-containing protein n=1 Tax=Ferruginibacter sp. SUN106 TaxID=2978348 RepID=UPI003D369F1F